MVGYELKLAVKEMRVMGFSQGQILRMVDAVGVDYIDDEGNCYVSPLAYNEWVAENKEKYLKAIVEGVGSPR